MTYEEFWPRYLAGHADRRTRALHYLATAGALACIPAAAITADWGWLIAVVGMANETNRLADGYRVPVDERIENLF